MRFIDNVKKFIDNQYAKPKGLIGTYIGEKMVRQHKPETLWTIELLNVKQIDSILELGCGSGYAMKLIIEQKQVDKVVGLDISPTVIRSATIRNKKGINKGKEKLFKEPLRNYLSKMKYSTKYLAYILFIFGKICLKQYQKYIEFLVQVETLFLLLAMGKTAKYGKEYEI